MLNRHTELIGILFRPVEGLVRRHAADEIRAFHAGNRIGVLDEHGVRLRREV